VQQLQSEYPPRHTEGVLVVVVEVEVVVDVEDDETVVVVVDSVVVVAVVEVIVVIVDEVGVGEVAAPLVLSKDQRSSNDSHNQYN